MPLSGRESKENSPAESQTLLHGRLSGRIPPSGFTQTPPATVHLFPPVPGRDSPGVNQRKTRPQSLKRSSTGGFQAESRPQGSRRHPGHCPFISPEPGRDSPGVNQRKTRPQSLKRSSTGDFQAESRPQGSTHGFREQFVFQKGRRKNHKQICAGSAARSIHARATTAIMSRVKVPLYPWPPSAPPCHGCDYLQSQRLETVQDVPKNICVNQDNFRTFPLKNCSFLIGRA